MNSQLTWSVEDALAGDCDMKDVGMPRPFTPPSVPASEEISGLPPELASIPAHILKRDAMIAYQKMGGPQYLMANEQLLSKVLLKLLPNEMVSDSKSEVVVRFEWLSKERNEALNNGYKQAEVIENAPWKPKQPDVVLDAEVKSFVESQKPLSKP